MTHLNRQDFRLLHRLRVRWAEVDQQRIVFNPHYLMYIDTAFTDYWRALAVPYEAIPELLGGDVYVKKSSVEYHGSARLDDLLEIGLKCARIGNSSMIFHAGIFRADQLLVSAELVYVFADPVAQTSKPVPAALRELLLSFEAGASLIDVQLCPWTEAAAQASVLRREVFAEELQIAAGLDQDVGDIAAVHVLVRNRFGQLLATGRLSEEASGVARIARVAVGRAMRGSGFGRTAIQALVRHAAERGDHQVILCSQRSAQSFYVGLGFNPVGEPFVEAGVPHIDMALELAGCKPAAQISSSKA